MHVGANPHQPHADHAKGDRGKSDSARIPEKKEKVKEILRSVFEFL